MNTRKLPLLLLLLSLAALPWLGGCESTGPGDALMDNVHKFLPDSLIDTLKKHGMVFNAGGEPPDVAGNFYADMLRRKSTNIPGDNQVSFPNMSLRFFDQKPGREISLEYQTGSERVGGSGAFITGTGNRFTVYVPVRGKYTYADAYVADTVSYTMGVVYSGAVDAVGLTGFMWAVVLTEKSADPRSRMIAVGQGRVLEEGNDLAARVDKFPYP